MKRILLFFLLVSVGLNLGLGLALYRERAERFPSPEPPRQHGGSHHRDPGSPPGGSGAVAPGGTGSEGDKPLLGGNRWDPGRA